ncbi:MAG: MotA/TolQ/ExbB proton channel family protein [Kiritimatiellae bacterium]|nr:MotA/TolQ/ExbB proton channel family protein [Kiritimatiellia bacterium]
MKKMMLFAMILSLACVAIPSMSYAQEEAADAAPAGTFERAEASDDDGGSSSAGSGGFFSVVFKSGALGILLWLSIFVAAGFAVYFVVDCFITVRVTRVMPDSLIDNVTESMLEGDVLKALENCENEPSPLANILSAGFSHVEEGYEVIQEAISTAADLETERIMQKLTWMSVVGNIAPMLGLLGTVQGMIRAFANLAGGAPDLGILALNISQALYTTAGGLTIAVPCVAFYYTFRNSANTLILRMEAMTLELIKDLRNVEVVAE